MKSHVLKDVGTGLLGLALTVAAFDQEAAAQVDQPSRVVTETEDDGFEWGLLGLLGLIGLAGLMRRDREHTTHRDTAAAAGSHTNRT